MAITELMIKQTDGSYDSSDTGPVPEYIELNNNTTLADKIASWNRKQDTVQGKGLSTNDYTNTEKNKLAGIGGNAEVNVIDSISVNGTQITPDANGNVDIEIADPTNLAPEYHASATTTYGVASRENYGHARFGTSAGTAIQANDGRLYDSRTPVSHASNTNTYGLADEDYYGHTKVMDASSDSADTAAAASVHSVFTGLAGKCDNLAYDDETLELSLKAGNTVLETQVIKYAPKTELVVTIDDDKLNGQTITCAISGEESETLTETVPSTGLVTFGLSYLGIYTISCGGYSTTVTNLSEGDTLNTTLHVAKTTVTLTTNTQEWYSSTAVVSKNNVQVGTIQLTNGTGTIKLYETGTYVFTLEGKNDTLTISNLDTTKSITISNLELVSWSSGTDEQIAAMVDAYYDGSVTLSDIQLVWSVGQSRTMDLSAMSATGVGESHRAQTVELVIIGFDHDTLTTPINGKTKALITVNQKNCLRDASVADDGGSSNTENGYMNSSNTNVGGWTNCARRTWCNNVYYNAIPSTIKNKIKQVNKLTSAGNQSSTINTDADYIWLLSEIEIFGTVTQSKSGEGTRYSWFAQADSNRYKLPKWSSSNVSSSWWERSPYDSNASYFCRVSSGGSAVSSFASGTFGVAPAFCL